MKGCFEDNKVGHLKKRLWEAGGPEIDAVLKEYGVPSLGEMDRPGCYIQNTVRAVQEKKKEKNDVVLIPLGSTEVHGLHCASSQDTLQAARICEAVRRYTARQGREVNLALSPWMYGNHPKHHVGMLGTIPISPATLERLLVDVMFGLWADGYRKFIFVNNHPALVITVNVSKQLLNRGFDGVAVGAEGRGVRGCSQATNIVIVLRRWCSTCNTPLIPAAGYLPDGHFNKSANRLASAEPVVGRAT